MQLLKNAPIKRKLMLVIMLTSGISMLLVCTAVTIYELILFQKDATDQLTTMAEMIGHNSKAPLIFEDADSATQTLDALRADSRIVAARIYGNGGEAFASYSRDPSDGAVLPSEPLVEGVSAQGSALLITRRISIEGEPLGTIVVYADLRGVRTRLVSYGAILGMVFVGSFLVALLLSSKLQKSISGPILQLTDVARVVSTEKNYTVRATKSDEAEVGVLIDAFNSMLDTLAASRERLHESEERYARAVRGANDGIWDWNLQTDECYFSTRWKSMLGYEEQQVGNTPDQWFDRILEEDRVITHKAVDDHIAGHSEQLEIEYRIQHRDGSHRWCLTRGLVVTDDSGTPLRIAGSQTDITRRKNAEELKAINTRLLESSRQAGMAEIATSVLHNIGNVLNSANVSTSLLSESISHSKVPNLSKAVAMMREHGQDLGKFFSEDEKGRRFPEYLATLAERLERQQNQDRQEIAALETNIAHIKAIVNMHQSYSSSAGILAPTSMAEMVDDAIRLNDAGLARHGVSVERDYSPAPPVMTDRHKVLLILVNLISNAKYALDQIEGDRQLRIAIRRTPDDRIQVAVSDRGVGIAHENLNKIFAHGFTTRKDGHGFGLHSSALAAKELHGSLLAESDGPGCGTTFTLELPLANKEEAAA